MYPAPKRLRPAQAALAALLLLASALGLLPGCGDDDAGPDPAKVCPTLCEKEATCDLLGNATEAECVTECLGFAENMLPSYLEAITTCTQEKTCAELDGGVTAQGLCYEENVSLCTTDTAGYVEAACRLELSCDGNDDPTPAQLDACMDRMHADGNILICFEPAIIDSLQQCVEEATSCTPNPVNACVLDIVGLTLGQGTPPH